MSEFVLMLKEDCVIVSSTSNSNIDKTDVVHINEYGDLFEEWKKALISIKNDYSPKNITVVLPINYTSSRVVQIPYAKGKQLDKMAKNAAIENGEEELVDYSLISSNKKQGVCICCGGIKEEILNKLVKLFNDCELEIKSFTVPMEGNLREVQALNKHVGKTMIYLLFEDNMVMSLLFKDGVYHYSARSRLFSERGTLDFRTEITRIISGIQQFYSTEKIGSPISELYYVGCSKDDFEVCLEELDSLNIESHCITIPYSSKEEIGDEFGVLGLLSNDKKKCIDFYSLWKEKNNVAKADKSMIKDILFAPAITLGVCLVLILGMSGLNFFTNHQINKMNDWINSDEIQKSYNEAYEKETESEKLALSLSQVENMRRALATYPDLTKEMINTLVQTGGNKVDITISGFSVDDGVLSFSAASREVIDIPRYVRTLQDTNLFSKVEYTGYNYDEGRYVLSLSCVLNAAKGGNE